jgi:hypothetical protein
MGRICRIGIVEQDRAKREQRWHERCYAERRGNAQRKPENLNRNKTMFTKSDLTKKAKSYGYSVKFNDGEIEAYPINMRGESSFFESDDEEGRKAILATIKADFSSRFAIKLDQVKLHPEIRSSLQEWHDYHGAEWLENLYTAWMNGRYDGFTISNVSGWLQQLRNTNGHAIVRLLPA